MSKNEDERLLEDMLKRMKELTKDPMKNASEMLKLRNDTLQLFKKINRKKGV